MDPFHTEHQELSNPLDNSPPLKPITAPFDFDLDPMGGERAAKKPKLEEDLLDDQPGPAFQEEEPKLNPRESLKEKKIRDLSTRLERLVQSELAAELQSGCYNAVPHLNSIAWCSEEEMEDVGSYIFRIMEDGSPVTSASYCSPQYHLMNQYPRWRGRGHAHGATGFITSSLVWKHRSPEEQVLLLGITSRDRPDFMKSLVAQTLASVSFLMLRPLGDAAKILSDAYSERAQVLVAQTPGVAGARGSLTVALESLGTLTDSELLSFVSSFVQERVELREFPWEGHNITATDFTKRILKDVRDDEAQAQAEGMIRCPTCLLYGMEAFQLQCEKCENYDSHTFCRLDLMNTGAGFHGQCGRRTGGLVPVPRDAHVCKACINKKKLGAAR